METGRAVVVKTGVPSPGLRREMSARRLYAGRGSVRLLRGSIRHGAMLLERLEPGDTLAEVQDDEQATRIAAACMRDLWTAPTKRHFFPTVIDWSVGLAGMHKRYGGGPGPLPAELVAKAEAMFLELLATSGDPVLLHGDLHHDNILRRGDGWRVIDPKGLVGEREYECGAWLRNPADLLSRPNVKDVLDRRIAIFAEMLGFERQRIRDWAFAQAVLSAWWCLEDGGDCWEGGIAIARYLE